MNDKFSASIILKSYKESVYAKDAETFRALYADNIHVFDMWGSLWEYRGIEAWSKMADGWFESLGTERVVVDWSDVQEKQVGEMSYFTATVKYTGTTAEGEALRSLQNRITCVLERIHGVWKITHEHTSAPADHATLKVALNGPT